MGVEGHAAAICAIEAVTLTSLTPIPYAGLQQMFDEANPSKKATNFRRP